MDSFLDHTVKKFGDGKIIQIESGETIFKLDSYERNPIVKPKDIGLTWYENVCEVFSHTKKTKNYMFTVEEPIRLLLYLQ